MPTESELLVGGVIGLALLVGTVVRRKRTKSPLRIGDVFGLIYGGWAVALATWFALMYVQGQTYRDVASYRLLELGIVLAVGAGVGATLILARPGFSKIGQVVGVLAGIGIVWGGLAGPGGMGPIGATAAIGVAMGPIALVSVLAKPNPLRIILPFVFCLGILAVLFLMYNLEPIDTGPAHQEWIVGVDYTGDDGYVLMVPFFKVNETRYSLPSDRGMLERFRGSLHILEGDAELDWSAVGNMIVKARDDARAGGGLVFYGPGSLQASVIHYDLTEVNVSLVAHTGSRAEITVDYWLHSGQGCTIGRGVLTASVGGGETAPLVGRGLVPGEKRLNARCVD